MFYYHLAIKKSEDNFLGSSQLNSPSLISLYQLPFSIPYLLLFVLMEKKSPFLRKTQQSKPVL